MVTSTFTPESAQSFHRYSPINAATVKMRLACGCEPYKDVFTYNRWLALGYQVQRGERSIKIPVIVERENEDLIWFMMAGRLSTGSIFQWHCKIAWKWSVRGAASLCTRLPTTGAVTVFTSSARSFFTLYCAPIMALRSNE